MAAVRWSFVVFVSNNMYELGYIKTLTYIMCQFVFDMGAQPQPLHQPLYYVPVDTSSVGVKLLSPSI
jgi:hypothetical protein